VVISPITTTRPVVHAVSQATRPCGSSFMIASSTASEIGSHILSGWPSVTDSEVSVSEGAVMNVVVISMSFLCARFPGGQILPLLVGERVDRDAHRRELQAGDLVVDLVRHRVDLDLQLLLVVDQMLDAQRL